MNPTFKLYGKTLCAAGLATTLILSSAPFQPASAQENEIVASAEQEVKVENAEVNLTVDSPYSLTEEDGSIVFFDNQQDYDSYVANSAQSNTESSARSITPSASWEQTTSTLISDKSISNAFIGYHPLTPAWSYASGYSLQQGESFAINGSYSYNGFTAGVTFTQNVSATTSFTANQAKASRLGVWSNLRYTKFKHVVTGATGAVVKTYYSEHLSQVGVPTLKIKYQ
ncbi:hypothetical protein [Saccharibacillus sacchari]|uniref:Uncharacterized protein n=1 Tax=Saccharibacillus sacchari TaxID=456493 RepID=A0ACC6PK82_9BACL